MTSKFEFRATQPDNTSGVITYGGLSVSSSNSYDYANRPVYETIKIIKQMLDGDYSNNVVINNVNGYTGFKVTDNIFELTWGTRTETFGKHSVLKCSYPENKEEIDKFLIFLHTNYIELNMLKYSNEYMHLLKQSLQKLKKRSTPSETDDIVNDFIAQINSLNYDINLFASNELHNTFVYTLIMFMTSHNYTRQYFYDLTMSYNLPSNFLTGLYTSY